jgi:hypothetical protein
MTIGMNAQPSRHRNFHARGASPLWQRPENPRDTPACILEAMRRIFDFRQRFVATGSPARQPVPDSEPVTPKWSMPSTLSCCRA